MRFLSSDPPNPQLRMVELQRRKRAQRGWQWSKSNPGVDSEPDLLITTILAPKAAPAQRIIWYRQFPSLRCLEQTSNPPPSHHSPFSLTWGEGNRAQKSEMQNKEAMWAGIGFRGHGLEPQAPAALWLQHLSGFRNADIPQGDEDHDMDCVALGQVV